MKVGLFVAFSATLSGAYAQAIFDEVEPNNIRLEANLVDSDADHIVIRGRTSSTDQDFWARSRSDSPVSRAFWYESVRVNDETSPAVNVGWGLRRASELGAFDIRVDFPFSSRAATRLYGFAGGPFIDAIQNYYRIEAPASPASTDYQVSFLRPTSQVGLVDALNTPTQVVTESSVLSIGLRGNVGLADIRILRYDQGAQYPELVSESYQGAIEGSQTLTGNLANGTYAVFFARHLFSDARRRPGDRYYNNGEYWRTSLWANDEISPERRIDIMDIGQNYGELPSMLDVITPNGGVPLNAFRIPGSDMMVATFEVQVVPEPASMTALALGLGALATRRRKSPA